MSITHRFLNQLKFTICYKRFFQTTTKCLITAKECRKFDISHKDKSESTVIEASCMPKVVVIGAGMAGLSAAVGLVKAGIHDVVILEATERPGGRIYSCWLGSTVAEVGAQWIPGTSISNSVITLASQEGILERTPLYKYDYSTGVYITSDGRPLDKLVSTHAYLIFRQIEKQAYALYKMGAAVGHGSLMNFFSVRIGQELSNFPANQRKDAACIMYGLTNKVSNRWGAELTKLSADLFGSFTPLSGETIGVPLGFVGVLAPLIKQIPDGNILYSKIVNCISWDDNEDARVVVTTSDDCRLTADYVVFTPSLGVLKKEGRSMFSPPLPSEKIDAINKIGYGNISKIFIEYNKPFWLSNQGPIKFAWTVEELNAKDSWTKGLSSLEELPGSQQILMATVSGKHADDVEKIGDMDIAENITTLLRNFTKDQTIPYPDSILRSKWKSSPFFCGGNSYMDLQSSIGYQRDLMTPIPDPSAPKRDGEAVIPTVFFAGEATCPKFFSTVNGARLSGLRAAQEIINLTKKIGGCPVHKPKVLPTDESKSKPSENGKTDETNISEKDQSSDNMKDATFVKESQRNKSKISEECQSNLSKSSKESPKPTGSTPENVKSDAKEVKSTGKAKKSKSCMRS